MDNSTEMRKSKYELSPSSIQFLGETAKWAKFLAILAFVGLGLMVLGALGLFVGGAIGGMSENAVLSPGVLAGIYLLMALIYFFPVSYLYNFAAKIKKAFRSEDAEQLEAGLEYLKKHYKFLGIFTIVFMASYMMMFIFVMIAGFGAVFGG